MEPDSNSIGHYCWFNFAVKNGFRGHKVTFKVINFTDSRLQLDSICYLSKASGKGWQLLKDCFFLPANDLLDVAATDQSLAETVAPRAKNKYILQFSYTFEHSDDTVSFALCRPYNSLELSKDVISWHKLSRQVKGLYSTFTSQFVRRLLCYTPIGRKVYYYEAYKSHSILKTNQFANMKVLLLAARLRPNETNSSFVLKGFMEKYFELKGNLHSEFLRDGFLLVVLPFLNPDGALIGNSRCSLSGQDLNRVWKRPDRYLHPEAYYTKKLVDTLAKKNHLVFSSDLHSNPCRQACYVVGSSVEGSRQATREFPVLLFENSNFLDFSLCK